MVMVLPTLKKLIDDAINNAEKSLNAEKSKLECPVKYKGNESTCQHFQKLIDQHEKSDPSQKSKNESNLELYKNAVNSCSDSHSRNQDSATKKALQDIEEREKQLKDLESKLSIFTEKNKSDDCKKLLENLCTGLEKFLGFNSDSKGYTGQGIVYSDLDRLCDAVVAFLYQVLKDVSEKQPYKVGKEKLNEAVEMLNNNLSTGREGFKVIEQVARKVREYNESVKESNKKVRDPISTLQDKMGELKTAGHDFTGEKTQVDEQLQKCKQYAKNFNDTYNLDDNDFNIDMRTSINDLNDRLRDSVLVALNAVQHETDRLTALTDKERMDWQGLYYKIQKILTNLEKSIGIKIKEDIERYVYYLRFKVKDMKNHLEIIQHALKNYLLDLQKWIHVSDEIVKTAWRRVETILEKVDGGNAHNKKDIVKVSKDIGEQVGKLHKQFTDLKVKYNDVCELIKGKDGLGAKGENGGVLGRLKKLHETVEEAVPKRLSGFVRSADGWLLSDIESFKGTIATNVKTHVGGMLGGINKLVEGIKGANENGGLKKVEAEVKKWAADFNGADKFGEQVEKWVADILDKDEIVKKLIKTYVRVDLDVKRANVAAVFKSHLNANFIQEAGKKIEEGIQGLNGETNVGKIKGHVEVVHSGIDMFVQRLGQRIKQVESDSGDTFVKNIATQIHNDDGIMIQPKKSVNPTIQFINAVKYTLNQLVGIARKHSVDLKWLISEGDKEGNLKKVDDALGVATNLYDSLTEAVEAATNPGAPQPSEGSFAQGVKQIAAKVSDADAQLGTLLYEAVKKGIDKLQAALEEPVISKLKHIDNNLIGLGIIAVQAKDEISRNACAITDSLDAMCDAIKHLAETDKDSAKNKLNELRIAIGHTVTGDKESLQQLHSQLSRLQSVDLQNAIHSATDFVDSIADREKTTVIRQLKEHIYNLFRDTNDALTIEARKNYVSSIKLLVEQFVNKVADVLKPLPGYINKDLEVGFKGFMKTFGDMFTSHVVTHNDDLKFEGLSFAFARFWGPVKDYVQKEIKTVGKYINAENDDLLPELQDPYSTRLEAASTLLHDLLGHFCATHNYDHNVPNKLDKLTDALAYLTPECFSKITTPTLDCICLGLNAFMIEMRKAYISRYDGCKAINDWLMDGPKKAEQKTKDTADDNKILTTDGRNGARVCVTVVYTLYQYLYELFYTGARNWKKYTIKGEDAKYDNALQKYLKRSGYELCNLDSTLTTLGVTGRLFNGFKPYGEFNKDPSEFKNMEACADYFRKQEGPVVRLFNFLETYNEMCHFTHISKPRSPCNVYEMCIWLTGLSYRRVYDSLLHDVLPSLLEDPNADDAGDEEITVTDTAVDSLAAYPQPIRYNDIANALTHICSKSYDVITTVVGHGDAETHYASEYCDNSFKLRYPTDPSACLDMLLDILRRLFAVFNFLQRQCSLTVQHNGWRDCYYGRDVNTSKQPCKVHLKCKPTCQPNSQPKCQATCEPNCQPTSPLQSYLNDCLPGHLPHQITDVGCSYKCSSCSNSTPGMPCLTPLGFRAFSGSTKTGRDICDILEEFFCHVKTTSLFCLQPKPPKTLAEHLSFSLSLAKQWQSNRKHGLKDKIHSSIDKVSISLCKTPHGFTSAISSAYGSSQSDHGAFHPSAESADVSSLSMQIKCSGNQCAPYLYSLYDDVYSHIALKNSGACLSWALYLPWDFHNYLQNLLKAFKEIFCQDWGCRGCLRADSCKRGSHGEAKPPCHCTSIVDCKGVSSTLYNYGFAFGNASALCAKQSAKTCSDFCSQLKNVLNSEYFKKLFEACDEFLWIIRQPFSYLVLALWLLSFLYLLHIMVIRLDLLHIKSHLHSPSSHRIAAQSLLAAARVNKLGRVFYLQP
ncbi:hypothetical protein BBBOND_0313880 [Babesia bigemina]|uniref:C3H1-type domain-containing protein n=1 Tax=Babesia bigemina TaxID=5866 RepID=A0A061D9V2_BABBI|nr:hypothetical protein BBBOND_0313880 [Babesia bigemina]CDR97486.1 hypothetical protein BBBOND_0313880 [Babesia bigemina]|eukprot:XP_012769672.1 hypothetical protein BBBOND_0313880 [Babesia bigemina]